MEQPALPGVPRLLFLSALLSTCRASFVPCLCQREAGLRPQHMRQVRLPGAFKDTPSGEGSQLAPRGRQLSQLAKARVPAVRDGVHLGRTAQAGRLLPAVPPAQGLCLLELFSKTGLCLLYTSDLCLGAEGTPEGNVYSPREPHSL